MSTTIRTTPPQSGNEAAPEWVRPLIEAAVREALAAHQTPGRFLELPELLEMVPLGERTVRAAIRRGWIPHIRLPGARRLLFDPVAVRASLRRFETGGVQQ